MHYLLSRGEGIKRIIGFPMEYGLYESSVLSGI